MLLSILLPCSWSAMPVVQKEVWCKDFGDSMISDDVFHYLFEICSAAGIDPWAESPLLFHSYKLSQDRAGGTDAAQLAGIISVAMQKEYSLKKHLQINPDTSLNWKIFLCKFCHYQHSPVTHLYNYIAQQRAMRKREDFFLYRSIHGQKGFHCKTLMTMLNVTRSWYWSWKIFQVRHFWASSFSWIVQLLLNHMEIFHDLGWLLIVVQFFM